MDSYSGCNLICDLKSYPRNVLCQSVGIFLQYCIKGIFVLLIYFSSQIQRNPILLQKNHSLAHFCFFCYLNCNFSGFLLADSLHFSQSLRFLFHNPDGILAKSAHNPSCQCCTNTFDRSGAQISFHSICVLWNLLYKR